MWRRAFVTMLLSLTLTDVATARAASPPASATGGSRLITHDVFGLDTLVLQHFGFGATLTGGETGKGWFDYRDIEDGAPFSAGGPITCLTVIGNEAWIGGVIDKSNEPTFVGLGAWWHVTDNGHGAESPSDITTFLGVGSLADAAAFCADHPPYRFPFPIDGGDIRVSS